MEKLECKVITKRPVKLSFMWTVFCFGFGLFILNYLFQNERLSDIISVLMPLYFIVWLSIIYTGHVLIRKMLALNFYTTSVVSSSITGQIIDIAMPTHTQSNINLIISKYGDDKLPRKTPIVDSKTSLRMTRQLFEWVEA